MELLYLIIIVLVPMVLSLSVHEWAHAFSAFKLGDDTAKRMGRLTLNPMAHIDPIGTIVLPLILTYNFYKTGVPFFFGWAKPVPVVPSRFRRSVTMRTGGIITAVAGPASNIVQAFIAAGIVAAMILFKVPGNNPVYVLMEIMVGLNVALAVFNMIPVPPLDGHWLLPDGIQDAMRRNQMVIFIALIVAINFFSGLLAVPITFIEEMITGFWKMLLGGLA